MNTVARLAAAAFNSSNVVCSVCTYLFHSRSVKPLLPLVSDDNPNHNHRHPGLADAFAVEFTPRALAHRLFEVFSFRALFCAPQTAPELVVWWALECAVNKSNNACSL